MSTSPTTPPAPQQARKRILVADSNSELLKELGQALQRAGFEVLLARDGSRALEHSILKTPDIVIIQYDCPLIDAQRFASILRSNPRTENTPLVVMSEPGQPSLTGGSFLEQQIIKPFLVSDVVALISSLGTKVDAAQTVNSSDRAVTGELSQMGLVDLLQVFAMNKRSGKLSLTLPDSDGEISVVDGAVVDAAMGVQTGPKALYRLLSQEQGEFAFSPVKPQVIGTISGSVESLVMEGLRQLDEWRRLQNELPPLDQPFERVPSRQTPDDIAPASAAVLEALARPHSIAELIDAVSFTDFEVGQAISHLIEAKLIQPLVRDQRPEHQEPSAPVLADALIGQLRAYLAAQPAGSVSMRRPRVLVVADAPKKLTRLSDGLKGLIEFHAEERGTARFGYGQLGVLVIAPDLHLELMAPPMRGDLLPLAVPLADGAIGVVALAGGAEDSGSMTQFREVMTPRLGVPWLEVVIDDGDATIVPRALRGILSAVVRALAGSRGANAPAAAPPEPTTHQ